jgi:hypothetical protein
MLKYPIEPARKRGFEQLQSAGEAELAASLTFGVVSQFEFRTAENIKVIPATMNATGIPTMRDGTGVVGGFENA